MNYLFGLNYCWPFLQDAIGTANLGALECLAGNATNMTDMNDMTTITTSTSFTMTSMSMTTISTTTTSTTYSGASLGCLDAVVQIPISSGISGLSQTNRLSFTMSRVKSQF